MEIFILVTDAIKSIGSGVQIKYGEWDSNRSNTINCNFYPIIIFIRYSFYTTYITGFLIRPETELVLFNKSGSGNLSIDITWSSKSVQASGISGGYTYAVMGT